MIKNYLLNKIFSIYAYRYGMKEEPH